MNKKIICIVMSLICLIGLTLPVSAVKMYAPDGREASVHIDDVSAWKNVGWYDYPVTKVYSADGRTAIIAKDAVKNWIAVGWYTSDTVTMYAPDGREATVKLKDISSWEAVGWYSFPVTVMYTIDGRSAIVAKSDIETWESVGWFKSQESIYRHIANIVIGQGWGNDLINYIRPKYSCTDLGSYYLFVACATQNVTGEEWYKVYKNNMNIEYLGSGSDWSKHPLFPYKSYTYYWY